MNKIVNTVLATVLSCAFVSVEIIPANSAPVFVPQMTTGASDALTVDFKPWQRRKMRRQLRRHNNRVYLNGHRGYRQRRRGYRRHGDFWFPFAAFATGAIIGGALANDRPPSSGNRHVRWCYNKYRSYRASDNTFQPYHGPRKQCYSPY